MSSINFDNVYLLLIAIPLIALLSVPFAVAVRKDNRNGHNIASMALHVLMAVLIAFAAAGTQVVTVVTETDVYVVADVSYSANKNLDTVDHYIENLSKSLPRNSKLGVVCFGKDYELQTELGKKIQKVSDSAVDDSETNIVQALEYAGTLFKDGVIKYIVLITDGKQTYTNDSNELKRTVDNLKAQNIHVDAIYLNDNLDVSAKEVQISSAEYTKSTYLDHEEQAQVLVQSSFPTSAFLTLFKNGETVTKKAVSLTLGSNLVSFDLDTTEAGVFDYNVVLEADGDECDLNNTYSFTQTVSSDVKILAVTESFEDCKAIIERYGDNAAIDVYENDASVTVKEKSAFTSQYAENENINIYSTAQVPYGIEDLCLYDEIILADADLTDFANYEMFIQSLDTAVSLFGKSLVTFGDLSIQSKTEGELTALDNILPVRFGDATGTPKLYTIVIDVSSSMQIWSRMILAKKAAIQLINFLGDDDYVCIVAFSGDVQVIQKPESLANREAILANFDNIDFRQGTLVGLGLSKALETIKSLNFSEKQVMLITDGLTYDGFPDKDKDYDAKVAVETMHAYGIVTSVLQVGGGYSDSEKQWLQTLAMLGGGNYYLAETETELGVVLFGDIQKETTNPIVEENTWITKNRPRDEVLSETDLTDAYISRYVLSSSKSSATDVLTVSYRASSSVSLDVPLYSYWNYGNGKVASYTGMFSEMKLRSGDASDVNESFFESVFETCIPAEKIDYPYVISASVDGKTARIELTPSSLHASAVAEIGITAPSGERISDIFVFDSSGYYYEMPAQETGKYLVDIVYSYGGNSYASSTSFTLSYEPEYDAFAVFEASVLYKMLGGDGTVSEDGNLSIVNDETQIEKYTLRLTVPFLILCVVLFVVDIIIRKLKWNDIVSLFRKVKPTGTKK